MTKIKSDLKETICILPPGSWESSYSQLGGGGRGEGLGKVDIEKKIEQVTKIKSDQRLKFSSPQQTMVKPIHACQIVCIDVSSHISFETNMPSKAKRRTCKADTVNENGSFILTIYVKTVSLYDLKLVCKRIFGKHLVSRTKKYTFFQRAISADLEILLLHSIQWKVSAKFSLTLI